MSDIYRSLFIVRYIDSLSPAGETRTPQRHLKDATQTYKGVERYYTPTSPKGRPYRAVEPTRELLV